MKKEKYVIGFSDYEADKILTFLCFQRNAHIVGEN